jgi:hypothetical protein
MKTKISSLILLAMLMLSIAAVLPKGKADVSDVEFYITPTDNFFQTGTTPVGTKFNITVMWKDSGTPLNGVYSWQVMLVINTTLLNCTKAWAPTWDANYLLKPGSPNWNHPAASGLGTSAITIMGTLQAPAAPVQNRSAKLAIFQLQIMKAPAKGDFSCLLEIDDSDTIWSPDGNTWYDPMRTNGNYKYSSPYVPPPPAMIQVDPARITDPLLTPCHNFTVDITISSATDVYGFSFELSYNQTIIHAAEVQLGSFIPALPSQQYLWIDNVLGNLGFSAGLMPPELPRSGEGILATIKFHVEAQGNSSLHLHDIQIFDNTNETLPSETRDGYFNNALVAQLYVDPPAIIDPTLLPPKTFNVNITINNVENLYGYEFNISYNKDVLTCLYVIVNDVLNETNYTPETQISNARGFGWVQVTYYSPAVPITTYTPLALATICFRVKSLGATPLHLHDTSLVDSFGNPIPHEVTDGFVMTVIHDIAVTSVTPESPWAYAGWPVNIEVVVKNLGNVSETFDVDARYNGTMISSLPVTSLAPGAETTMNFTWDTTGVSEGNYQISANATIVPYEINVANNVYVDDYVYIFTAKRDVAITDVSPGVPWAYQGWLVKINVTAANLGEVEESFNVTAYVNDTALGTVNLDLAGGVAVNLTFVWNTGSFQYCHNYTISAQASIVPYEYNTTNNIYVDGYVKVRIVGDLNGDGKVDVKDVAPAALAYGSYGPGYLYPGSPPHPRWNPAADINLDNKIDVRDIALISRNFGMHC